MDISLSKSCLCCCLVDIESKVVVIVSPFCYQSCCYITGIIYVFSFEHLPVKSNQLFYNTTLIPSYNVDDAMIANSGFHYTRV